MLMRKNVNSDVSKDSPVPRTNETKIMQRFGRQIRCIMGNVEVAYNRTESKINVTHRPLETMRHTKLYTQTA